MASNSLGNGIRQRSAILSREVVGPYEKHPPERPEHSKFDNSVVVQRYISAK
jgi:hypothetical protein